jgi:hypothetical protein
MLRLKEIIVFLQQARDKAAFAGTGCITKIVESDSLTPAAAWTIIVLDNFTAARSSGTLVKRYDE